MTPDDLAGYRAIVRPAVRGTYRGYDIVSMPPPSSGGTLLVEILNILEGFELRQLGPDAPHVMAEAMKLAYADRAQFLGRPRRGRRAGRAPDRQGLRGAAARRHHRACAARRLSIAPRRVLARGQQHHALSRWSIASATRSPTPRRSTSPSASAWSPRAPAILLNNELDDFAAKPGAPNAYGLVGGAANAPGPGKRPLSSMTPTIVLKDGKVFLVTGSPGGSRIITTVLQVITNVIDHSMNIARAVAAPRIHHQWLPDEVMVEQGVSPDVIDVLEGRGHKVVGRPPWGSANSIMVTPDGLAGAADPRTRGSLAVGH